jgi:glycerol-3-phosphate acyltransferase PlsY
MNTLYLILIFFVTYLLGSFPTAYLITKRFVGKDIRKEESKNVGALNVMRVTGKIPLFLLTAIFDVGKGALAVFIAQKFVFLGYDLIWATTLAAFGVILGHCFSIYFFLKEGKFSGGKAQASLIGALAILNFKWLLLPWAGIAILFIVATQTFFFGQFMGNIFLPFIAYYLAREHFWAALLMALPIFIKQWPHLLPALKGKRPKWYWKKNKISSSE